MTKFEDNISPYISFVEGAAPSSPAATNFRLYYDSADHLLKWKNSAGTVATIATGTGAGTAYGQTYSYPTTFSGDVINGSSTTPFVDVAAFDTKEVLNSRILHLQTKGASKDQRVRVTLGTTKAGAFDVATCIAFNGPYWSAGFDTYLEIRLSTSADAQIAIARIGPEVALSGGGSEAFPLILRVGGSSISAAGVNLSPIISQAQSLTLRFVRDGSNVIVFSEGLGTAPMALGNINNATSTAAPFSATVSGTLARVEYSIHSPSGPGSTITWDAYVDYLASV